MTYLITNMAILTAAILISFENWKTSKWIKSHMDIMERNIDEELEKSDKRLKALKSGPITYTVRIDINQLMKAAVKKYISKRQKKLLKTLKNKRVR
ncbi:hypothetical protein [uncultured Bacteroides sp.]|uniref:hypothetical protein n=1 Tax=uncultured Bacteroides sp. TaxID=162156 RepID=UPI002AAAC412|nr:hypothetical protein [uncultured Bacteroides sp.]